MIHVGFFFHSQVLGHKTFAEHRTNIFRQPSRRIYCADTSSIGNISGPLLYVVSAGIFSVTSVLCFLYVCHARSSMPCLKQLINTRQQLHLYKLICHFSAHVQRMTEKEYHKYAKSLTKPYKYVICITNY